MIGSGGWLPTLSRLLTNAYDITSSPQPLDALLSDHIDHRLEGARTIKGANYTDLPQSLQEAGV